MEAVGSDGAQSSFGRCRGARSIEAVRTQLPQLVRQFGFELLWVAMGGDAVVVVEEAYTTAPCDPSKSVFPLPQGSINNVDEHSQIEHAKVVWQKSRWIQWLLMFVDWRIRCISDQSPYASHLGLFAVSVSGTCAMMSVTPLWWFCRPTPGSPIDQQVRELQSHFEVYYTALSFRSVLRANICNLLAHQVRFASDPYAMLDHVTSFMHCRPSAALGMLQLYAVLCMELWL